MTRIPEDTTLGASDFRVVSFTLGPFQATLFPLPGPVGDAPRFSIDLYHGGTTFTHPRFVCTVEEVVVLARLALAAEALVRDYLGKGKSFSDWCEAYGVNPFNPEIAS